MSLGNIAWVKEWGGQLAGLAEEIVQKVPEGEEWSTFRHFLQNVQTTFRRGDIRAGVRAVYQVLPFVQRAIASTEKVINIDNTYKVTETITQHFLVDDDARHEVEEYMAMVKKKVQQVKHRVEVFADKLDQVLDDVITHGKDFTVMASVKIAFEMNRISAHIKSTEEHLRQVRAMIDALDSHVTAKSSLATLLSYLAFIVGIVLTTSGNLPLSAACFTAASASRKSAQSLEEYRKQLMKIDAEHKHFQTEVKAWKHHFRSEQLNFLLLVGAKRLILLVLVLFAIFVIVGKAANFLLFACIMLLLLYKSEETNERKYYCIMGIGALAMAIEIQQQYGLAVFNTLSFVIVALSATGFLDL